MANANVAQRKEAQRKRGVVVLSLDPDEWMRFYTHAGRKGLTVAEWVLQAVRGHVNRAEQSLQRAQQRKHAAAKA